MPSLHTPNRHTSSSFNGWFLLKCMLALAAIAATTALLYVLLSPAVITVGIASTLLAASSAATIGLLFVVLVPVILLALLAAGATQWFWPRSNHTSHSLYTQAAPWFSPFTRLFSSSTANHHGHDNSIFAQNHTRNVPQHDRSGRHSSQLFAPTQPNQAQHHNAGSNVNNNHGHR